MGGCVRKIRTDVSDSSGVIFHPKEDLEERFNNGKPILLESGLKIRKNPQTNKLEGIPQQWLTNLKLPVQVDYQRVIKTKNLRKQIRPDDEFPEPILELLNSQAQLKQSKISTVSIVTISDLESIMVPVDSKLESKGSNRKIDIQVDKEKPFGLKNLPEQWITTVSGSFMDPREVNDPAALATIISHYDEAVKVTKKQTQLLSTQQFEQKIKKVKFIQDNPNKNFLFGQQIGKGGVCKVFKAEARYAPGTFYAVRIMKQRDVSTLNKIRGQIAVMEICSSSHIVQYNFTYYYKESLFMFIEYMNAGSLTSFIKFYEKKIPQRVIAYILRGILKGLLSIHQHYQIHRDIKSDNVLLSKNGQIKIADFGYALQLTQDKLNGQGLAGTAPWMAPELIKKEQYDQTVDIWSLGILTIQLCQGQPPYLRMKPLKAMYKIASEDPPKVTGFSEKLTNFISNCVKKDPSQRWRTQQLLQHPFITQLGLGLSERDQFLQMVNKYAK